MKQSLTLTLFMLLLVLMPCYAMAVAPEIDADKPIEITADTLDVVQEKHQAIFSGKVEAVQGNTTLYADQMIVHYRDGKSGGASGAGGAQNISLIDVRGNVVLATPTERAKGNRGFYYTEKKLMRLIGGVVLTKDKNIIKGDALEYNLKTGRSKMVSAAAAGSSPAGSPTGGRVKGLFMPN